MAARVWSDRLAEWIAWTHEGIEEAVRGVAPDMFSVRPSSQAPSVAFHAWHIGRWADLQRSAMSAWLEPPMPTPDIWTTDDVARRWNLADVDLGGYGGAGVGLDDEASAAVHLPDAPQVLEYVTAAFRGLEGVVARFDDDALGRTVTDIYGDESTIADAILSHLSHADRHLGMIEALRGVLGERGTATV
jgi:DinB superfamily